MIRLAKRAMVCIAVLGALCGGLQSAKALTVSDGTVLALSGFANDGPNAISFEVSPAQNLRVRADFFFDSASSRVALFAVDGLAIALSEGGSLLAADLGAMHAGFSYFPLIVGHTYDFSVEAGATTGGTYGGTLTFAATPIPPAFLMFGTALVAIGWCGTRRRAGGTAA